jgi:hypothetical protein
MPHAQPTGRRLQTFVSIKRDQATLILVHELKLEDSRLQIWCFVESSIERLSFGRAKGFLRNDWFHAKVESSSEIEHHIPGPQKWDNCLLGFLTQNIAGRF